jgi:hypothetical protein
MGDASQSFAAYREFIPDETYARFSKSFLAGANTYEWFENRINSNPFVGNSIEKWKERLRQPYKGITTDGEKREGLYELTYPPTSSHRASTIAGAAKRFLDMLSPEQLRAAQHDVDADEFRAWSNAELYVFRHGVRLEECSNQIVAAVHNVLRASLSPSGYKKARGCMRVNHFLGTVVDAPGVLNENSYNFSIFGTPSPLEPWGWQLTGHHLCLNTFLLGDQQVISPVFMGAEPNIIDEGPEKGMRLFESQEATGRIIMTALESLPELQARVQIYKQVIDKEMPDWRFHRADQRHLGGAFQDNRIVPYEGVLVTEFPVDVQSIVRKVIVLFLDILPEDVMQRKLDEIEKHWGETYFCWIGQWNADDSFYYKVHSPVVMLEFDHHSGVFLTNKESRPFHIHTLVRTPNGNDYGKELLQQYTERAKNVGTSSSGNFHKAMR